jgi:predicted Zn-dependent protease
LTPGEAAMMPIRMQSPRMVDSRTAPLVAADARRIAAAWPGDPGAQLILAEAELDAGDAAAAEAAADRALVAEPGMRIAMIFKARAQMARAQEANRFDDATWRAARGWLLKANKLQPDAAWPLMLFYSSFLQQGEKPTANAVSALKRSAELTPQDNQVRMMLVGQYLRDRQLKEARALLAPLAFDPHASSGNPARRLLERLDRDGLAAVEGPGAGLIAEPILETPPEDQ